MTPTPSRVRPRTPQEMFDRAAPYYDRFNSLLSMGSDRRWRRAVAREVDPLRRPRVLDVATGTGSVALAIVEQARRTGGRASVWGVDLNAAMLAVARRRTAAATSGSVHLVRAAAHRIPFPDQSFDAATIAFAIDDVEEREECGRELFRVLRPGGRLIVLELGLPPGPVMGRLYQGVLALMSLAGRIRRVDGYRHLREEISTYRGADAVRDLLTGVGFGGYRRRLLTRGIAVLHVAERPDTRTSGRE
ncbi:ubiquinone/menaquinone biosynthesis methyltransferase [Micromonospora zingiberis]|uniref:Ubiquinone/menaquinone biosynthesis methyltransferase n=1 Tax=Micromonospora zingiberis TaxID=2053011 RepID=A0A4R0GQK2_9ACTN|nr:ubiquinone/menaquinone biosynthesis methyltransferase [Micromonospora zingiberis]TCB97871.1 ubiquinone/menaquinone biosynthesis methyltransferase [Micromonospora zingiberis]